MFAIRKLVRELRDLPHPMVMGFQTQLQTEANYDNINNKNESTIFTIIKTTYMIMPLDLCRLRASYRVPGYNV